VRRLAPVLAAAATAAAALTVAACTRTVSHELDEPGYHFAEPPPPGTADAVFDRQHFGGSVNAYEGDQKARAFVRGGSGARAVGAIDVGVKDGYRGYYGAAFYLPPGTITGPTPRVSGDVDLMGWRKGAEFGGIRLSESDRRARLVGAGAEIGSPFTLREGCWNWIVVRQRLSATDEGALNEVFLNGEQVVGGSAAQKANSEGNGADRVEWGLSAVSTSSPDLEVYVDNAYVSNTERLAPRGEECSPLPNVLLIVTDDQRADTVVGSAADNPLAEFAMPKTRDWFRDGDAGIEDGTEFPNGFATNPWCCPARASIMTGQYTHNHGVKMRDLETELPAFAPKLQYSLQRYLRDWWGYRTALFGKFLNNWTRIYDPRIPGNEPPETYFDEYEMFNGQYKSGGTVFPRPCNQTPNTSSSCIFRKPPGPYPAFEQAEYTTHYFRDRAKDFINRQEAANDAQPWFLYVAPYAPHEQGERNGSRAWSPMTNGSDYHPTHPRGPIPAFVPTPAHHEGPERLGKPPWVRGDGGPTDGYSDGAQIFEKTIDSTTYPGLREQQIRVLGDVDDMVDEIFRTLEQNGEADNTLAFFVSDNGYMWREHSPTPPGSTDTPNECYLDIQTTPPSDATKIACGLVAKAKPYRESIQVPFFLRWPNGPQMPLTDQRLVAHVDLAPTVIDAVGGLSLLPHPMDGRSLFRFGQRDKLLTEAFNLAEVGNWASVVEPNGDQYIFLDADGDESTPDPSFEEFYENLATDGQKTNRYGANGVPGDEGEPERRWPLSDLGDWRNCAGSVHQPPPPGRVACP
jgi:arylsulfatase A-like enzyme